MRPANCHKFSNKEQKNKKRNLKKKNQYPRRKGQLRNIVEDAVCST